MHRHLKFMGFNSFRNWGHGGNWYFTITGTAAATLAGPALVVSIVISAICVSLSALFFAEFASRVPATGGVYSYLYAILGEFSSLDCRLADYHGIYDSCFWCRFWLGMHILKVCLVTMESQCLKL